MVPVNTSMPLVNGDVRMSYRGISGILRVTFRDKSVMKMIRPKIKILLKCVLALLENYQNFELSNTK